MNTPFKQKRKKWPWILLVVLVVIFAGGFYAYSFVKNLTPDKLLQSDFVQKQIVKKVGEDNADLINLIPEFLGFHEPKTYLVLFLNNTELRPGGGFIGSYATLQFNQGQMNILQMGGTENMDTSTSQEDGPQILKEKLLVDRWYFRDSNWYPDFASSTEKTLEFYKNGHNIGAEYISGVVAITTDVLEDLMKVTGPFTVDGVDFTSENVIEKLEYEVEYGYRDRGVDQRDRKDIMKDFMLALMNHIKVDFFKNMDTYKNLGTTLLKEKNIVLYSLSPDWQKIVEEHGWAGRMQETNGDYLMWVDANLSALKTDFSMRRKVSYSLSKDYIATAEMNYNHVGQFDWRTSAYLDYARVYVPVGSELISATFAGQNIEKQKIDSGVENGKQWFGTYIKVEPGTTKKLSFSYKLPFGVRQTVEEGNYSLVAQKQIGMNDLNLELNLDFVKNIVSANPAEEEVDFGDSIYSYKTEFKEDKNFVIKF